MIIRFKVGSVNQSVEVKANKTEIAPVASGKNSYTISADELQQLTLVGRDSTEIVTLMPGAVLVPNGGVNALSASGESTGMNSPSALGNLNINGQSVDITMDGGHTFDPGAAGSQSPVAPNRDMISEVKILISDFTAENAKGPEFVNTNTKSGGAAFHGDVHFYARNHTRCPDGHSPGRIRGAR